MHNDICISTLQDDLCRLVGIHFDHSDVYHIVRRPARHGEAVSQSYETMVGACESLKGKADTHDYLDEQFARNDCAPSDEFIVSADTREEFGRQHAHGGSGKRRQEALAEAYAYYDEEIAPALDANAPGVGKLSPWQIRRAANREAIDAFATVHPDYAETVADLHWCGLADGVDTYFNFPRGRLAVTFDRATGTVRGPAYDRRTGEETGQSGNVHDVLWGYVPAQRRHPQAA